MAKATRQRSCDLCGEAHETHYDAVCCDLRHAQAENRRMRDALLALDGVKVIGTAAEPGIGHEAFWRIVRRGLGLVDQGREDES